MRQHPTARNSSLTAIAAAFLLTATLVPAAALDRCGPGKRSDADAAKAAGVDLHMLKQLRVIRGLRNEDICTMPQAKLDRSVYRILNPKPDSPGEWAEFRALEQTGDDGKIDPAGLINGLQERREMLESLARGATKHEAAGITSEVWESIGPGNIGGRVRSFVIHPTDTKKIWLASISGGIWHSADAGKSWKPVNDFMASVAVSTIVFDPKNPDIMYAGTGEGFFNLHSVRGAGIFKSTDGGVTWKSLETTNPKSDASWYYVNRIAIDPTNSNNMLVATQTGIFRSTDGGKSWTKPVKIRTYDMDYDPKNPKIVIAGAYWGFILRSTDGGETWKSISVVKTPQTGITGRIEVAYAYSKTGTVYASVDHENGKIARSRDSGKTWTVVSTPKHLSAQGWYANALWVDPTNSKHLIVGGLDIHRSTNSGKSFKQISQWWSVPKSAHADHHFFASPSDYKRGSNPIVYFANDGGLYRANVEKVTLTTGWENLNNGLDITQFYSVAASKDGKVIIGGTQDNGSLVRVGTTKDWAEFRGGDGGFSAVDQTDGSVFYGEYIYLALHRRAGEGTQAKYICRGITEGNARRCGGNAKANFIAPFMLDPNNQSRMLAGAASLWITDNAKADPGPSWRAVKGPIAGNRNYIKSIAVAEGNSDIIWLGYNRGEVHATYDGGQTWKAMSVGPKRAVNRILIDKDDHKRVYVAYGGYAKDNLHLTTDGGATWKDTSGSLPEVPIRGLTRHPKRATWLYAGTEVGLYTSENGGETWSTKNDGPGTVSVDDLVWVGTDTLIAATHGRGIFRAKVTLTDDGSGDDGTDKTADSGTDDGSDKTADSGADSSGGSGDSSGGSDDSGGGSGDSGGGTDSGKEKCGVNDLLTGKCE